MGSRWLRFQRHQETQVRPDALNFEARVRLVLESGQQKYMHGAGTREERVSGNVNLVPR